MSDVQFHNAHILAARLSDALGVAFRADEIKDYCRRRVENHFADLVLKMADLGIHPKPTPGAARNKKANASGIAEEFYRLREALSAVMWEMAHVQNQLKGVDFDKIRRIGEDALAGKMP